MRHVIPTGTQVLIYEKINRDDESLKEDIENKNVLSKDYIKGSIVDSKKAGELGYKNINPDIYIYTILGEDGNTYEVTQGVARINQYMFVTVEDRIRYYKVIIENNYKEIDAINKENELILELMNDLVNVDNKNKKLG